MVRRRPTLRCSRSRRSSRRSQRSRPERGLSGPAKRGRSTAANGQARSPASRPTTSRVAQPQPTAKRARLRPALPRAGSLNRSQRRSALACDPPYHEPGRSTAANGEARSRASRPTTSRVAQPQPTAKRARVRAALPRAGQRPAVPVFDERPADRDTTGQHERPGGRLLLHVRAREPAGIVDLLPVHPHLAEGCASPESQHQAGRQRPRLVAEVGHLSDCDAGLLHHLSPDGVLKGLARLQEAGQGRVPPSGPGVLPAEQQGFLLSTRLAVRDRHDHGRVDARKLAAVALAALELVARQPGLQAAPAAGAEPRGGQPLRHADRVEHQRRLLGPGSGQMRQEVPDADPAVPLGGGRIADQGEPDPALAFAEQHPGALRRDVGARGPRDRPVAGSHPAAGDQQHLGLWMGPGPVQPLVVRPVRPDPIVWISGQLQVRERHAPQASHGPGGASAQGPGMMFAGLSPPSADPLAHPWRTMTAARRLLAYVLPVHDEADGLRGFHDALVTATDQRPDLDFEFVYVDDGSRDGSLDLLLELRAADERVTVISLARNFGHQIAVTAGLDAAAGRDAIIIMDTDLQDPPDVSLRLIETWEAGVDVAYAQRRTRRDSPFKRGTAYSFYWLLSRLASVEIPRNVGDFRLMDRKVVAEVIRYREHDRFLRGIVSHVGFRQEAVPFARDSRYAGSSSYPVGTMLKLAADGILGFSTFPLRLISRMGMVISLLSVIGALWVIWVRAFQPERAVPGWAFITVGMFLLGGIQLLMMGVIGSYLGRVYIETQDRPLYSTALIVRGRSHEVEP